ncbi:MAG: ABC transporter permease [Anaerolineales bacterium]|nr:MAG: ABC transporter permease [Anaerolineales bacterium]
MKKILIIGWKDLKVTFRDRAALIMLVGPFVLTLAMGWITGGFSKDGDTGLSQIPVVIVNHDEGQLGEIFKEIFYAEDVKNLFNPTVAELSTARQQVDDDQVAAAVIIPAGFSASVLPGGPTAAPAVIEVYVNPARPITAGIVKSIVQGFVNQLEIGVVGGQVTVSQLIATGVVAIQDAPSVGQEVGMRLGVLSGDATPLITLKHEEAMEEEETADFNPLALLAPGMAILFLMYTVSSVGGRSILSEQDEGTLPRMLTTPSTAAQVLGGKVLGILMTGFVQVGILIVASSLIFSLPWGDPLAVLFLVIAAVAGATGWGILLAAFAKTPAQVSSVGTAMMLLFGIIGGSFFGGTGFPGALGTISKITPNAWAGEGFMILAGGGTLSDILSPIGALLIMAAVLFAIAVTVFRRRGLAQS